MVQLIKIQKSLYKNDSMLAVYSIIKTLNAKDGKIIILTTQIYAINAID